MMSEKVVSDLGTLAEVILSFYDSGADIKEAAELFARRYGYEPDDCMRTGRYVAFDDDGMRPLMFFESCVHAQAYSLMLTLDTNRSHGVVMLPDSGD